MSPLALTDPNRRRTLVGVVIHLDEMDGATAALCRYVPGSGIAILTTKPAAACVPWLVTIASDAAAYVLAISPEAARNTDAVELALDIIDAAERMDVPVNLREPGPSWTFAYFVSLTGHVGQTTAPEIAAAQAVCFYSVWQVKMAAGQNSHRKARARFESEQATI